MFDMFYGKDTSKELRVLNKHYLGGARFRSWQLNLKELNNNNTEYVDVTPDIYDRINDGDIITVSESPQYKRLLSVNIDGIIYDNSSSYINVLFYLLIPITGVPVFAYSYCLSLRYRERYRLSRNRS